MNKSATIPVRLQMVGEDGVMRQLEATCKRTQKLFRETFAALGSDDLTRIEDAERAMKKLGVVSEQVAAKQRAAIQKAYVDLRDSGKASMEEMSRARAALNAKLERIDRSVGSASIKPAGGEGAGGGGAGGMPIIGGPGFLAAAAAATAAIAAVKTGIDELAKADKSFRMLQGAVELTAGAIGISAEKLAEFSEQMEKTNLVSAEEVQDAMSKLSSFSAVSGENFTKVIELSQDMAARFGGNIGGEVEKFGRVLESIAGGGVEGLSKAFKFLSASTKDEIENLAKLGKTAEATDLLLREVEKRIGGSGKTAAGGLAGGLHRVATETGNVLEEVAKKLWIDVLVENRAAALGRFASALKDGGIGDVADGALGLVGFSLPGQERARARLAAKKGPQPVEVAVDQEAVERGKREAALENLRALERKYDEDRAKNSADVWEKAEAKRREAIEETARISALLDEAGASVFARRRVAAARTAQLAVELDVKASISRLGQAYADWGGRLGGWLEAMNSATSEAARRELSAVAGVMSDTARTARESLVSIWSEKSGLGNVEAWAQAALQAIDQHHQRAVALAAAAGQKIEGIEKSTLESKKAILDKQVSAYRSAVDRFLAEEARHREAAKASAQAIYDEFFARQDKIRALRRNNLTEEEAYNDKLRESEEKFIAAKVEMQFGRLDRAAALIRAGQQLAESTAGGVEGQIDREAATEEAIRRMDRGSALIQEIERRKLAVEGQAADAAGAAAREASARLADLQGAALSALAALESMSRVNISLEAAEAEKTIAALTAPAEKMIKIKVVPDSINNIGPAVDVAMAGLAGVPGFADGGYLRGPGGPRDDKILMLGSNGEYVLRAAAVNALGVNFLDHLNAFGRLPEIRLPGYADGGLIGQMPTVSGQPGGGKRPVNLNFGGASFELEAGEDVVKKLAAAARAGRRASGGRAPGWVR